MIIIMPQFTCSNIWPVGRTLIIAYTIGISAQYFQRSSIYCIIDTAFVSPDWNRGGQVLHEGLWPFHYAHSALEPSSLHDSSGKLSQ